MNQQLAYKLASYLGYLEATEKCRQEINNATYEYSTLHVPTLEEYAQIKALDKDSFVSQFMLDRRVRGKMGAYGKEKPKLFDLGKSLSLIIGLFALSAFSLAMFSSNLPFLWATTLFLITFWVSFVAFIVKTATFMWEDLIPYCLEFVKWYRGAEKWRKESGKRQQEEQIVREEAIEAYITKQNALDRQYQKKAEEYNIILPTLKREYEEKSIILDKRISELQKDESKYEMMGNKCAADLEVPYSYQHLYQVRKLTKVVSDGRADSIKEAINIVTSDDNLEKQAEYARQQTEYARQQAEYEKQRAEYAQQQAENTRVQIAVEYLRLQQEKENQNVAMNAIQEIQNMYEKASNDSLKAAKKRGETQCYNCTLRWSCSQKMYNDNGMCTAFTPR